MIHPAPSLSGLDAGCSAMSWETADQRHLWGRNFDFNTLASDSRVTYLPRGTCYAICDRMPENRFRSAYAAVGTGLLSVSLSPLLYEGINDQGLMGGQLYYRELACYEGFPRPGTTPLQPPVLVYHLLAQCATVAEVVHALREEITLLDAPLLGTVPPLHWSFSDRTGETIVVEPDRDGLHIYRNTLGVMTNSPDYPWHRTNLLNYAGIRDLDHGAVELAGQRQEPCFSGSGAQGLPGDWSSPSRFVRLAFLKTYGVKGQTEAAGVNAMFRLLESAAFPMGMVRVPAPESPGKLDGDVLPYDYTVYTAVACAESLRFYWTTYENSRIQFVDLSTLCHQPRPLQFELGRWPDFRELTSPSRHSAHPIRSAVSL